jgi:hypothetical protein
MAKEQPLWHRIYFDPVYTEIARAIGYAGCTYRDMLALLEPLGERFGKQRVESATYHLVTFEGQMTCNPKPLAQVSLRAEVRKLCWQLLGPPPETEDEFYRHPDGTPVERLKKADEPAAANPAPKKRTRKKAT